MQKPFLKIFIGSVMVLGKEGVIAVRETRSNESGKQSQQVLMFCRLKTRRCVNSVHM